MSVVHVLPLVPCWCRQSLGSNVSATFAQVQFYRSAAEALLMSCSQPLCLHRLDLLQYE